MRQLHSVSLTTNVYTSGRTPRDSPWEGRRRRARPALTNNYLAESETMFSCILIVTFVDL